MKSTKVVIVNQHLILATVKWEISQIELNPFSPLIFASPVIHFNQI